MPVCAAVSRHSHRPTTTHGRKLVNYAKHWIAIALALSTLPPTHAQTKPYMDLRNAGRAEYRAGHFLAAESILRTALDAAAAVGDSAATGTIENDLGDLYLDEERPREAEQSYRRALDIFEKISDRQFETAAILRNLGSAYSLQRRHQDALKALDQAGRILTGITKDARSQALTAEILNSKGIVFLREGKLRKAHSFFEDAIQSRSGAGIGGGLGDAQTLNNIGTIYFRQRRYTLAEQPLLRSAEITEQVLGPTHPELTLTLATLGEVYTQLGRFAEAMNQYDRCLAILRATTPRLDGRIVRVLQLVSSNYLKRGDKASAERTLSEAVGLARKTTLSDDLGIPDMFDSYANLLKQSGKNDQAQDIRAEAKRLRAASALTVRAPADHH
jgi:tetratricopeptide (TPR) repeat protein